MKKLLLACTAAALYAASLLPVADWMAERLESRYPPKPPEAMPTADAILVLGGGLAGTMPPRVIPQLSGAGSRAWYGARLWKANKAPIVVAVGGGPNNVPESEAIREFLVDLGVKPDAIVEERESRTTAENALRVKPILDKHDVKRSLLVTSSMHMQRAHEIFRAAGMDVIPASADAEAVRDRNYRWRDWLPNGEAVYRTQRVIKELMGLYAYRLQFWLDA